jgi:hypothetical protein
MEKQEQVKIDIDENLSRFFPKVELFNDGDSYIMYKVTENQIGLSQTDINFLKKKGLNLFSLYLIKPKNGLSVCSMQFVRRIKKND